MVLDMLIGDHLDCVHGYVENHLKCEQDHSKPRILDCMNRDTEPNTKHVFAALCINRDRELITQHAFAALCSQLWLRCDQLSQAPVGLSGHDRLYS